MKWQSLAAALVSLAAFAIPALAQQNPDTQGAAPQGAELSSPKQQASYAFGLQIAKSFKSQHIDLDAQAVNRGIADGLSDAKPALSDEQMTEALQAFQQEVAAKQAEENKSHADTNKKQGEAYLEANKAKEGVKTLPSGLQYKVLRSGDGEKPGPTDMVTTHYRGTLTDGTEFDSSIARGEPATFPVNGVIKGWTEALQLMKVGDKWEIVVPSDLAYGERGAGEVIGPHSVLVFEIELLGIKKNPGE